MSGLTIILAIYALTVILWLRIIRGGRKEGIFRPWVWITLPAAPYFIVETIIIIVRLGKKDASE